MTNGIKFNARVRAQQEQQISFNSKAIKEEDLDAYNRYLLDSRNVLLGLLMAKRRRGRTIDIGARRLCNKANDGAHLVVGGVQRK